MLNWVPIWWPDVLPLAASYVGMVYFLLQQTRVSPQLAEAVEASDVALERPNPLYSTFKSLYLNDAGGVSIFKSFVLTVSYVFFFSFLFFSINGSKALDQKIYIFGSIENIIALNFIVMNLFCDLFFCLF